MTDIERVITGYRDELTQRISGTENYLRTSPQATGRRADMARARLALYRDMLATVERHERAPQYAEVI